MTLLPSLNTWIYFVWVTDGQLLKIVYPLLKVIQFGFPALWTFIVDRKKLKFLSPRPREILLSLVLGLVFGISIWIGHVLFFRNTPVGKVAGQLIFQKLNLLGMNTPLRFCILAFVISILHSGLEEYFWRWFVFSNFRQWLNQKTAIVVASFAFVLHHTLVVKTYMPAETPLITHLCLALAVWLGGAIWCAQFEKSQNIFGPWISHIGADIGLMFVGFDMVWGL